MTARCARPSWDVPWRARVCGAPGSLATRRPDRADVRNEIDLADDRRNSPSNQRETPTQFRLRADLDEDADEHWRGEYRARKRGTVHQGGLLESAVGRRDARDTVGRAACLSTPDRPGAVPCSGPSHAVPRARARVSSCKRRWHPGALDA